MYSGKWCAVIKQMFIVKLWDFVHLYMKYCYALYKQQKSFTLFMNLFKYRAGYKNIFNNMYYEVAILLGTNLSPLHIL